jgi:hypothetical protein
MTEPPIGEPQADYPAQPIPDAHVHCRPDVLTGAEEYFSSMAGREKSQTFRNTITATLFVITLLILAWAIALRVKLSEATSKISQLVQDNENSAALANTADERFAQLLEDHRRLQRDFAEIPKLRGELSRLRRVTGNYSTPEPQLTVKESVKAKANRIRETLARMTKSRSAPESPDELLRVISDSVNADLLAGCTVELTQPPDEHHGPKFKITGANESGATWTLLVDDSSFQYQIRNPNSI